MSVFARKSVEENLSVEERKRLVEKMLSKSYRVVSSKNFKATKAVLPAMVGGVAGGLYGGLGFVPFGHFVGASIGFFAGLIGYYAHDSPKWATTSFLRNRVYYFKAVFDMPEHFPSVSLHEAIHFLGKRRVLGLRRIVGDRMLANATHSLFDKQSTRDAVGKVASPEDFLKRYRSEDEEARHAGKRIGNYALRLGNRIGFNKAAWDFLYLLSRGVHYKTAEGQIRQIYAEKRKGRKS